jgi:hypothetical protein
LRPPAAAVPNPAPPTPVVHDIGMTSPGPKKETARITVLPDPPAKPAAPVQMKKTQPLSTMPEPVKPISPITVAPATPIAEPVADTIPMALCWALLGISAIVLLVQIWNYLT